MSYGRGLQLSFLGSPPSTPKTITLPCIPLEIDPADLCSNGKLLTDEQIHAINTQQTHFVRHHTLRLKQPDKTYTLFRFTDPATQVSSIYIGAMNSLGEGSAGKVEVMQDIESGSWAAVKILNANDPAINNEIAILTARKLLLGCLQNETTFYIAMKFAPGENLDLFTNHIGLNTPVRLLLEICLKTVLEVDMLHKEGIIHCDLKPENIIYDASNDTVALIDYGNAIKKGAPAPSISGSIGYIAPEIRTITAYNEQTDVYALGKTFTTLFSLLNQDHALVSINDETFVKFVSDTAIRTRLYYFFQRMIHDNPCDRPSTQEAISFFTDLVNSLHKKVALVDVQEYMSLTQPYKDYFYLALSIADQVFLTTNLLFNRDAALDSFRDLSSKGICVSNQIIQKPHVELLRSLTNAPRATITWVSSIPSPSKNSMIEVNDSKTEEDYVREFSQPNTPSVNRRLS